VQEASALVASLSAGRGEASIWDTPAAREGILRLTGLYSDAVEEVNARLLGMNQLQHEDEFAQVSAALWRETSSSVKSMYTIAYWSRNLP
jgi:hypothetical protein